MTVEKTPVHKGYRLAIGGVALATIVVMLGSFTRLVDAGLGCPDWPGCYGHLLWPNEAHEIEAANSAFPDMPVIAGKPWPEMVHRYAAGLLGLLVFALTVIGVRHRKMDGFPYRQSILLGVLVVWQALFGMWTVTLKLWPQVVTAHLLGGFATFTLLTVLVQRLSDYRWRLPELQLTTLIAVRPMVVIGIILVVIQSFLGGWMASNYAAFGCPDFPTCTGKWWPNMDIAHGFNLFQQVGPNYLGGKMESVGRTAIHFIHRLGAIVTAGYLIAMGVRIYKIGARPAQKLLIAIWTVLFIQVMLGILNVLLAIPLFIAVAHNFVGVVLLALTAALLTQINRAVYKQQSEGQ